MYGRNLVLTFIALILNFCSVRAGEGMWLPHLLKALNEKEMKSMGMKISAEDIYSINKGSLKDAIVHFGGFCTSEVISNKGLLLTNHHCGYDAIQSHSSIENNIIKHGFWAKSYADELPNPDLFATFIDKIEDVTPQITKGVTTSMSAADRKTLVDKNIAEYRKGYNVTKFKDVLVRAFYDGNQYFAFFTTNYYDVRLVGAPPESIGKFGSDTDNWVWPRHTGDFSMFRIYADKNNNPADYSKDNVPFVPKHFLPISLDGVEEGDFTMVFGFPGRTTQYLPSGAVEQLVNTLNPAKIQIRETALKITDKYMRADEGIKIKYAAKYATIANYWKKWIGESQGLKQTNAIQKKKDYEMTFNNKLGATTTSMDYSNLINNINQKYKDITELALARDVFQEIVLRNVDLTAQMGMYRRLVDAYEKNGDKGYSDVLSRIKGANTEFYKDFDAKIDREKLGALMNYYVKILDKKFVPEFLQRENIGMKGDESYETMIADQYTMSSFESEAEIAKILELSPDKAVMAIKQDPLYSMVTSWTDFYNKEINTPYGNIKREIDLMQETYTKAQMEVMKDKRFYPDANSTMRVTYGQVKGYNPRDGVAYGTTTYLDGVVEKYVPGDYEFDLPAKVLSLHKSKDYGQYADATGKLPVCFIGSNHTTGGNSGSPAIDAYGNLIGLNFDRVWEGTMSDVNYDASICRNIMVDARYILWVVDKFAGADHLVKEMKLVHPKGGKKKKKSKCNC
jgi:hypothetical protein